MKKLIFLAFAIVILGVSTKKATAQSPALKADVSWNVDMTDHEAVLAELQKMIRGSKSQFNGGDKIFFGKVMEFILRINPDSKYNELSLVKGAFLSKKIMVEKIDGSLLTNTVYDKTTNSYVESPLGKKGPVLCLTLEEGRFKYVLCKLESLKDPNRPCFNPNLLKQSNTVITAKKIDDSDNYALAPRGCDPNKKTIQSTERIDYEYVLITYETECGDIVTSKQYRPTANPQPNMVLSQQQNIAAPKAKKNFWKTTGGRIVKAATVVTGALVITYLCIKKEVKKIIKKDDPKNDDGKPLDNTTDGVNGVDDPL